MKTETQKEVERLNYYIASNKERGNLKRVKELQKKRALWMPISSNV